MTNTNVSPHPYWALPIILNSSFQSWGNQVRALILPKTTDSSTRVCLQMKDKQHQLLLNFTFQPCSLMTIFSTSTLVSNHLCFEKTSTSFDFSHTIHAALASTIWLKQVKLYIHTIYKYIIHMAVLTTYAQYNRICPWHVLRLASRTVRSASFSHEGSVITS